MKRGVARRIQCKVCEETFSQTFALKEHMRVHTGEKPYVCDICSKQFRHLANFQKHKQIHFNEKKFSCEVCSQTFRRKSHLERHLCKIHKIDKSLNQESVLNVKNTKVLKPVAKKFSCKKCGKTCKTMSDMRKHWAWHCYAPPGCENPLKEPSPATTTVKTKAGNAVLKYFCKVCDKGYQFQSTLDVHVTAIHNGSLGVECVDCERQFNTLSQLHRHLKMEHNPAMETVNAVIRAAKAEENRQKNEKAERHVSDSLTKDCSEPIYEIESKDELLFLDAGDLEEECSVHKIPPTGLPNVMIHRIWQHYKAAHKEDLEKVSELCNLLINYGDSIHFEIEADKVVDEEAVHLADVESTVEIGETVEILEEGKVQTSETNNTGDSQVYITELVNEEVANEEGTDLNAIGKLSYNLSGTELVIT